MKEKISKASPVAQDRNDLLHHQPAVITLNRNSAMTFPRAAHDRFDLYISPEASVWFVLVVCVAKTLVNAPPPKIGYDFEGGMRSAECQIEVMAGGRHLVPHSASRIHYF